MYPAPLLCSHSSPPQMTSFGELLHPPVSVYIKTSQCEGFFFSPVFAFVVSGQNPHIWCLASENLSLTPPFPLGLLVWTG